METRISSQQNAHFFLSASTFSFFVLY